MENLFKRLKTYPSEAQKVKIMRKNILVDYIPLIALQDFATVEMLVATIKRLEQNVLPLLQTTKGRAGISIDDSEKPKEQVHVINNQNKQDRSKVGNRQDRENNSSRRPNPKYMYENDRPSPPENTEIRNQSFSSPTPMMQSFSSPPPVIQSAPYQAPRNPKKIICFNCNRPGHISRDCRSKSVSCYCCGYKGVTISSCPKCCISNRSKINRLYRPSLNPIFEKKGFDSRPHINYLEVDVDRIHP
ncbi:unnamed protein product [Diabrotica balteata]|uniref:CCHC-type domain-containing protein n=1 Tax=Diabrotica balteata TaxID=107213 RepID=A0A9N9T100_DIABA|nr:unnamed protein product [Diabrotica balteata]